MTDYIRDIKNGLLARDRMEGLKRYAGLLEQQAARDSASGGAVGAPGGLLSDAVNPYQSYGDAAVMGLTMAPGIGDIAGPLYDAQNFIRNPESRTIPNYLLAGLGVLPAIPSLGYLMSRGGDAAINTGKIGRQKGIVGGATGASAMARAGKEGPLNALQHAETLEMMGASPERIWQETAEGWGYGVFRGPDGKLRFEIDDSTARLSDKAWEGGYGDGNRLMRASEAVEHPEAAMLYDENTGWMWSDSLGNAQGNYGDGLVSVDPGSDNPLSTGLHELQHATQQAENFARGASPNLYQSTYTPDARAAIDDLNNEILKRGLDAKGVETFNVMDATEDPYSLIDRIAFQIGRADADISEGYLGQIADRIAAGNLTPMDQYRRTAGEAEARAVQSRMNLTPEARAARPFWMDYDVPVEDQIVRYGDNN